MGVRRRRDGRALDALRRARWSPPTATELASCGDDDGRAGDDGGGSRSRAVYGDIYDLPRDIGRYDVATFGCILLHLANPFAALRQGADVTDKAIIVTDLLQRVPDPDSSAMEFNPGDEPHNPVNWWAVTPGAVVKMLRVLGFGATSVSYHLQHHRPRHDPAAALVPRQLFTVVGERTPGSLRRTAAPSASPTTSLPCDAATRIACLEAEVHALRTSTSWRVSRPVRILGDLLKRLRR